MLPYLRSCGIDVAEEADVVLLGGGVSNVVIAIEDPCHRLVLKQSRARLQVSDVWEAPPERIVTEAAALQLAAEMSPGSVPLVLHVDADRNILVLERAPVGWTDWKKQLLAGTCDESVGDFLGTWLSTWHRSSEADNSLAARFRHDDAFQALRVDPFTTRLLRVHLSTRLNCWAARLRWPRAGSASCTVTSRPRTFSCRERTEREHSGQSSPPIRG